LIIENNVCDMLQKYLSSYYNKAIFINVFMGVLSAMGSSCEFFLNLIHDLNFDKVTHRGIIIKTTNIAIGQHITAFPKEIDHGAILNS